jgi:hypothetical protein
LSVVAIIKGGLGNQLFVYAAARSFALRQNRTLLIDDESGFVRDGYGRSFRLDRFPIEAEPVPLRHRLGDPKSFRHKFIRSLNKILPRSARFYLTEKAGTPVEALLDFHPVGKVVYLNGYWQNEAYFIEHADLIRRELEPPVFDKSTDTELEDELKATQSVFIHVRRGAYSPKLATCYYHRSIQHAANELENCRFEVFGDDIPWARDHLDFEGKPVRFHQDEGSDELRDFRLMAACRHAIVANSSFSWWAAWLRPSPQKRVWTPAKPGWPVAPAAGWIKVPNELVD